MRFEWFFFCCRCLYCRSRGRRVLRRYHDRGTANQDVCVGGGTRVRGDLCYRERTARALNRRVKCDDARAWAYAKYFIFLRTRDPCENAEDRFVRHVVTYRLDVRARSFDGGGNINYDAWPTLCCPGALCVCTHASMYVYDNILL